MRDDEREGGFDETNFTATVADDDIDDAPDRPTPLAEPRRIGRYELVHELGQGGMATVYLARMRGPGGFLKWVAIKTIHGHMSTESRITDMFLDEARIAASIQHPNVVQLLDLGKEDGELYIAMEYLHGEHLRSVTSAAHRGLGSFPYELAAYVIAKTARGLHHAHAAKDATGVPLSIVHRDVSPQNIIVTYDGLVKLTDFGVAKAAGRISKTMSGRVKGKWAYMAPEQVLNENIDRRADIFSLGTVLWEITTGARLFKAESEVRTVMRITSGRAPPPSSITSDYPKKLERIVMRALSRRPADRYATAAAMAEELDEFVALTGRAVGGDEIADLMETIFSSRIALKEEMLRREASKALADGITISLPEVTRTPLAESDEKGDSSSDASEGEFDVISRRPKRGLIALSIAVVAIGVMAAFWVFSARTAVVHLSSQPSGATVLLDGVPQPGSTPTVIEDVRRGRHEVELRLGGFETFRATFDAVGDQVELSYHLSGQVGPADPNELDSSPSMRASNDAGDVTDANTRSDASLPLDSGLASLADPDDATSPRNPPRHPSKAGDPEPRTPRPRGEAYVNLLARPWAKVWINGRPAGQTPLMRHAVPAGTIIVKLQAQGRGESRTIRLRAEPGQTVSRQINLHE